MATAQQSLPSVLNYETEAELFQALSSMNLSKSQMILREGLLRTHSDNSAAEKEVQRLFALKSFNILDTGPESIFSKITQELLNELTASVVCLNFVDLGRQWAKAISAEASADIQQNILRNDSFCAHAIVKDDILVVSDTLLDDRFRENLLVKSAPFVRFYAGAPLVSPEGFRIGTICVFDTQPREFSVAEQTSLRSAAAAVMAVLVERRDLLHKTSKRACECIMSGSFAEMPANGRCSSDEEDLKPAAKRSRTNSQVDELSENIILRPEEEEITVELPSPETANDPDDYMLQLVETMYPAVKLRVKPALELEAYFPVISEEQMARYTIQVVNMARSNDVAALKQFHVEHGRDALDCFNRFGEGLLNMACRRGFQEMADFLLSPSVALDVRVRDDYGRTPLHDACWNPEPQLEICTWIMRKDPSLFLVADKRGFTPFQYARKSDWPVWRKFLFENREHLKALSSREIFEIFQR